MSAPRRAVYPWRVASPTLDERRELLAAVPFFGGLSEKELEGLISMDHGHVVIHHPEALEQLAGCVVA